MESTGGVTSMLDQIKLRHSKEKKDLQAKMTAMKHEVPKGEKKRRKEVVRQCEQLEIDMKTRQESELDELERQAAEMGIDASQEKVNGDNNEDIRETDEPVTKPSAFFKETKCSKAQLKKERKLAEKAAARDKATAKDAIDSQYSQGNLENEALQRVLGERGLDLVEVAPDGDCLYSALAHQVTVLRLGKYSAAELRRMAANYIQRRKEEFLPFLVDTNEEDPLDEMEFDDYCSKVSRMCSSGGSWGGEAELRALSSALERRIEVLHANGRISVFGTEFANNPLTVTYHKFAYTLGEHYNSTTPNLQTN